MAPLKVWGVPFSTATQRVLTVIYEKGLDYELIPVDLGAGAHKKEPFVSLNPFGQVPAFEDGDLKMFESRAITQYLSYTHHDKGNQLVLQGPKMGIASIWMEVEAQKFEPAASKLNWELVFKPMFGMTTDLEAVKANEVELVKVLDIYEKRLSESKYLGGDSFTLADLHHLPNIQCLLYTPLKKLFDERPKVSAWVADITSRPSWVQVLALKKQA